MLQQKKCHQLAVEYLRLKVDIGVDVAVLPHAALVAGQDGRAQGVRRRRDCLRCPRGRPGIEA